MIKVFPENDYKFSAGAVRGHRLERGACRELGRYVLAKFYFINFGCGYRGVCVKITH